MRTPDEHGEGGASIRIADAVHVQWAGCLEEG